MKKSFVVVLSVVILFSCCSSSNKMQLYNLYKKEIVNEVFRDFERFLPASYEYSLMAQIRFAPNYKALGCSGIDVLYHLDSMRFVNNVKMLHEVNEVPSNLFNDTSNYDKTNSEYYSIVYNQNKIAIPKVNDDFCRENDTCFRWDDLEIVILKTGIKEVFSNNVDPEYQPENPVCKYSIGAFYSTKKQHIIYWLFIYN